MALTLQLRFLAQPAIDDVFGYVLRVGGDALRYDSGQTSVTKIYPGYVSGDANIATGATLLETVQNTLANLLEYNRAAGVSYSLQGNSIIVDFEGFGQTTVTGIAPISGVLEIEVIDSPAFMPFNLLDLSIEIIDTYLNERVLIEEFTQLSSPKLLWEGGDDLYQPMMPSKLTFNLLDETAADGRFLHLLTGDEQRFKVKVRNTDENGIQTLLWQGFILPDLYSEPYKNGAFFVEFTAIDMLSSLKGKFFEPWFYYQTFNLPKLLGYIMEFTALPQEFYIKPSLVNVRSSNDFEWRNMNISLEIFNDESRPANLYDILEKILIAQGMQIMSFRGKWFLQGITRRGELSGTVEIYHPDGKHKENTLLSNEVVAPLFSADLPVVTAETPWKNVNLNFASDSPANLYPEDIVVREFFGGSYVDGTFVLPGFTDTLFDYWTAHCMPSVAIIQGLFNLRYQYILPFIDADYHVTENMARANYFECNIHPFAAPGREYELELEVMVGFGLLNTVNIVERIERGDFDNMLTFQILQNGVEIMSNRPSFPSASSFKFEKIYQQVDPLLLGANAAALFKIKKEFSVQESGKLVFRFLIPIGWLDEDYDVIKFFVEPQVMRINVLGDYSEFESVNAVRDINYTRELDIDVPVTSSLDNYIKHNFGIAPQIGTQYATLELGAPENFAVVQFFPPATALPVQFVGYPINATIRDIVFKIPRKYSVFIESPDGTREHFYSLYTRRYDGVQYLAFITEYAGRPKLPKDYETHAPLASGQLLRIMNSFYPVENLTEREFWKIYGFPDDSKKGYMETFAYACHAVRPDTCFSIDANALALVWPLQLVQFKYEGDRLYLPTRLELNLSDGKTQTTMKESKLLELNDITYD